MKCPYCTALETKVIDSRLNQTGDITRRRRECPHCDGRFTTYERVEEIIPVVIKKDGRREPYDRAKVLEGVSKACQKRSVAVARLEELVSRVEKSLQASGLKEVPARAIGQMVMAELHRLDKVAYVRFASVYRVFRDVEEFVAELQSPPPAPARRNKSAGGTPDASGDASEGAPDLPASLTFPFIEDPEP